MSIEEFENVMRSQQQMLSEEEYDKKVSEFWNYFHNLLSYRNECKEK